MPFFPPNKHLALSTLEQVNVPLAAVSGNATWENERKLIVGLQRSVEGWAVFGVQKRGFEGRGGVGVGGAYCRRRNRTCWLGLVSHPRIKSTASPRGGAGGRFSFLTDARCLSVHLFRARSPVTCTMTRRRTVFPLVTFILHQTLCEVAKSVACPVCVYFWIFG